MATFAYTPDYGYSGSRTPRVVSMKFGDGYEQRAADGLHADLAQRRLTFRYRDDTEADAIEQFFADHGGHTAFDWTPPGGAPGQYVCRSWSRRQEYAGLSTIDCEFEEVVA
ncbi:MAG: phage tail protein [Gammaproteobacteria bacterium]|nr:phage tail protein [Gammaproteobacteria bacterium]